MIFSKEKSLKEEIIRVGKKLYDLRLVVAQAGNLSGRLEAEDILVTASGASLGSLTFNEIIKVNLNREEERKNSRLTTEFLLHALIYKNFSAKVVIHAHPILTNAYFAVSDNLKSLTFETKLYLGDVPVVEQETPAISQPELVIAALKTNNLVVIRNHGVVCIGENFFAALYLMETLEEAVKVAAVARLFKKEAPDILDEELKQDLTSKQSYLMFSPEHIRSIVELVNKDEFIAKKGAETDLTLKLAIRMDGLEKSYKFNFEKGRITHLEFDSNAPFVISASPEVWELVFLGKVDPFVATMQGRMKLKGELGKLSRWYVPFSRLFELFKQVKIK